MNSQMTKADVIHDLVMLYLSNHPERLENATPEAYCSIYTDLFKRMANIKL